MARDFPTAFEELTGNSPFPWQMALYERLLTGKVPPSCDLPTGLGKTSVIAVWLLARIAGAPLPRRLVYVVNRRTVVDQTTDEVLRLRRNAAQVGLEDTLAVSTLRGQMADNRDWSADPSKNAVICGTVDMIGSRLLFGGYRIGFRSRPLHAGFLGQDTLVVHDEAHLEPAFQQLLIDIQLEQNRAGDPWPIRVMELTATSRSPGEEAFRLSDADRNHPIVAERLNATKRLTLHASDERDLPSSVAAQALAFRDSGLAVLLYLRTIDAVTSTVSLLRRAGVQVQQLTGTMRGYERDRLVDEDPVFARFLPDSDASRACGTVYLVCTSAGEVGVNLSGDHLVCDLTTFDSMTQRFGRVNRFGERNDSELHVFHPPIEELDPENQVEERRLHTLRLLQALKGDASPAGLDTLGAEARRDAFAPEPKILKATEILFDSWALTTVPGSVPGRPEVAPYLHGVAEWEPPTAQVAWRNEVGWFVADLLKNRYPQEVLDDYPLKPHELLSDRTSRIIDALAKIAEKQRDSQLPVWVISERGRVTPSTLPELVGRDRKRLERELDGCTVLLSPASCGPVNGMLTAESGEKAGPDADVADEWYDTENRPMRQRVLDNGPKPEGMRLVRSVSLVDHEDDIEPDDERAIDSPTRCNWYERPRGADTEGSRTGTRPVLLDVHGADVEREAQKIVERLELAPALKRAVVTAARLHDIGKNRDVWQRSVGNTDRTRLLAKSGASMKPLDITGYRHELGSLLDAERSDLLRSVDHEEERELILHLIAAHHGRARPHFPDDELFDPEAHDVDLREVGVTVATRFAMLQKRFGRWGLSYLESLVRAADYAASANPSEMLEVTP